MESHLRLRNVPEIFLENTFDMVVELIAEFLGEAIDDIVFNFEAIYRVNSSYAQQKKQPRDSVVQTILKKCGMICYLNIIKMHFQLKENQW